MRKILLIISLSILPLTCFGASGNCEWLPYSTMGTAAGGAADAPAAAEEAEEEEEEEAGGFEGLGSLFG